MANTPIPKQELQEVATPERTRSGLTFTPRVDIVETDNELLLLADLPGVRSDDLDIRFENGELVLLGKCAARNENVDFMLNEYGVGDFYRAFAISETIDSTRIAAELKNGVLTVHLPKTERAKPKRIAVKAN
jgi:HSP20 family molecular chaperone IbpA